VKRANETAERQDFIYNVGGSGSIGGLNCMLDFRALSLVSELSTKGLAPLH